MRREQQHAVAAPECIQHAGMMRRSHRDQRARYLRLCMVAIKDAALPAEFHQFLRGMTKGRASFCMQFHHYDPVPRNIADEIMAKSA